MMASQFELNQKSTMKRKLIQFLATITFGYIGLYRNLSLVLDLEPGHTNISFVMPDNNNTCISMLSMGDAVRSFMVERSVRAIRKSGEFSGYIMVITDEEGFIRYQDTLSWDPKVIVMRVRKEDFYPIDERTGKLILYKGAIRYKRFKTFLLEYLDYDARVASTVRYVMYLDIDTVCCNKIRPFFEDYHQFVQLEYASMNERNPNFFHFSAYWDQGIKKTVHSGFMFLDRLHSIGCLEGWRHQFDNSLLNSDQILLKNMLNAPNVYNCSAFMLDGLKGDHYELANNKNLRKNSLTFIHITNTVRAKKISNSKQDRFLRKALRLKRNELMIGNITWEEVIQSKSFKHVKPQVIQEVRSSPFERKIHFLYNTFIIRKGSMIGNITW